VARPTDLHALSTEDVSNMATFRENVFTDAQRGTTEADIGAATPSPSVLRPAPAAEPVTAAEPAVIDRSIGDILAELKALSAEQVERILEHQRAKGLRFGEAAVALGLVSREDVLFALSRQFHYPYAPEPTRAASPELVTLNQPFGARAEHFRALRSQLMMRLFAVGGERHALAVISPDTLDGKTVGVIWNGRAYGNLIIAEALDLLKQRHSIREVLFREKPFLGNVAPAPLLDEMAAKAHVVITGVGD